MSLPTTLAAVATVLTLGACASNMAAPTMTFSQDTLPETVRVPAGHRVALETVGVGQIAYECRAKTGLTGAHEWVFVGPDARLLDRSGQQVGTYFGPPATWKATDGSQLTGKQLAVAPAGAGNIPLQLVQANPAMGNGAMSGVTHIQRVNTQGGVAPASACGPANLGARQIVTYKADYIFWKAA